MAHLQTTSRLAVLAAVLIAATIFVSPLAYWLSGFGGVVACAFAAVVIWFASAVATGLGHFARGPNQALTNLLISMLVRMALPLVACVAALASGSQLASSGFVFYARFLSYRTARRYHVRPYEIAQIHLIQRRLMCGCP